MTPSEILSKYKETGSADFLSELEGEDLWNFIARDVLWVLDPLGYDKWIEPYDELQPLVVAELRSRYRGAVERQVK